MSASPDFALVVVHDGVRKEFQIPKAQRHGNLRGDTRSLIDRIFSAFSVSSRDYDLQHYRSALKLNEDNLRSFGTAAAASNDALVCNLVRKKRRGSISSDVEERRPVELAPASLKADGPRCVKVQRQDGGFGFTLRYFVVHPPPQLKGAPLEPMDTIFVKQVAEGGPGEQAGLRVGDRLEMVNNTSVQGKSYDQVIKMVKSSGDVLSLLVTPREDDHIQELFRLDAYGPDGEGTVRSSKVVARSQDFTSPHNRPPLSQNEHFSQSSSEPFTRSAQGRSAIRNKTSPGTTHRRTSSSKIGLAASGSSSSVSELLQQLQQQKPTRTPSRTSSQSSLNIDELDFEQTAFNLRASLETSPSPATHKFRKAYLGQGRSVSYDSVNMKSASVESVDRQRRAGRMDTSGFWKAETPYSPSGTNQTAGYHERSASLTATPLSLSSKLDKQSASLVNLSSVEVPRRPRSESADESRSKQFSNAKGNSSSPSIPHYLKGPQSQGAAQKQETGLREQNRPVDKSVSLEELRGKLSEGRHSVKSSSLPRSSELLELYRDRASTGDESTDRLQPVASHSLSEEHIAESMELAGRASQNSSGSALQFSDTATDDWRDHLGSPVTTIMAKYAVNARRDGRKHERRHFDAPSVDGQPPFLRPRALSSVALPGDSLPVTEITAMHHQKSFSVTTRPPALEAQLNSHRRTASIKSNSLPHDSSPPQAPKTASKKRSGLPHLKGFMPSSRVSTKSYLQPSATFGFESGDDLQDVETLEKKAAGNRLSLSAPSSPTTLKKLMMLDGNKSDYAEDDDDNFESAPNRSRGRPFSRTKTKKLKGDAHAHHQHDSDAVAAVFKGDSQVTAPPELCKKTVLLPGGKTARGRSWRSCFAVQQGTTITFYKDEREISSDAQGAVEITDATINIQGCMVDIAHNYSKRPNVFRLQTADGAEYLLQASSFAASIKWIQLIRKAASADQPDGGGLTDHIIHKMEQQKQHQTDYGSRSPVEEDGGKLTTSVRRGGQSPGVKRRMKNQESGVSKKNSRWGRFRRKNSLGAEDKSFNMRIEYCPRSPVYQKIPLVVVKCVMSVETLGMDSIGIYRVPGNKTSVDNLAKEVDARLSELDLCDESKVDDINVVSSLLKLFFRQLPNPLLTYELYPSFMEASRITDSQERLKALIRLIQELPEINFHTLHYLICHLCRVAEHSDENKMEPNNLAIVLGPTLVRSECEEASQMVSDMGEQCRVIETLIKEIDQFFPKDDEFGNTYQKEDSFTQPVLDSPPGYRPQSVSPQIACSPPPDVTVEEVGFSAQVEEDELASKGKEQGEGRSKYSLASSPPIVKNENIRAIDIYGSQQTLSLETFLEEQSRESSRAQVAQAKQDTTERWVMMHQWQPPHEVAQSDDTDWLDNGAEISPEAKARADAVQQRGDSYRYETRRTTDKKWQENSEPSSCQKPEQAARWQNSANGNDDHYEYAAQTPRPKAYLSSSRHHARTKVPDRAAMLHRMSYVHAVQDGALPLNKMSMVQSEEQLLRHSFPLSPLDVPHYPNTDDGNDEAGLYGRPRASNRQDGANYELDKHMYQSGQVDDYEADHEMYPTGSYQDSVNHVNFKFAKKKSLQRAADELGHVATDL